MRKVAEITYSILQHRVDRGLILHAHSFSSLFWHFLLFRCKLSDHLASSR